MPDGDPALLPGPGHLPVAAATPSAPPPSSSLAAATPAAAPGDPAAAVSSAAAPAVAPAPSPAVRPRRWRPDFQTLGPLAALVLLVALGAGLNPNFLGADNITNVLTRTAFIGIIAVGATFVIITGAIDLSVGSMAALIAGVMIIVLNRLTAAFGPGPTTIGLGMAAGVGLGLAAGWVNGILSTKGRIDSFIVTLGTMGIFRSLVTYFANGGTLSLDYAVREAYRPVYYGSWLEVPIPVWVFLLVALVGTVVLRKTRFGRYCFAVGSNPDVARYSAVKVDRVRTAAFVVQGLCVSLATLLYVPRLGSASATTGLLWELEAITAVVVGGTALRGGSGRVWGSVAGAIILTLIGNILNLTNVISNYLNGAVQGVIIVAAALLQRENRRR